MAKGRKGTGSSFAEWWEENKDQVNAERRRKYREDPEYRLKAKRR